MVGAFFLIVLFAATVFNVVMQYRSSRRDAGLSRVIARVDALLVTWVETWGQSPAVVQERLKEVLQDRPSTRV